MRATTRGKEVSIREDIAIIFERDPAARSLIEVILTYPGLHAIVLHRLSHWLHVHGVPLVPRLISHLSRFLTGIEIHPGARIGRGFFVDHGMGVVIGETAELGDYVHLYQGVTLGGTGKQQGKRHPTLGSRVTVGAGAIVLGAITLGDNARVGAGSVVLRSVPANATAVGVPARVVAFQDPGNGNSQRVENMPDPEAELIDGLHHKIIELEQRLLALEKSAERDQHVLVGC